MFARKFLFYLAFFFTTLGNATPGLPGTLDPSWGATSPIGAGKTIIEVGPSHDSVTSIALQPDRKVISAGYCTGSGVVRFFCVIRQNVDGSLDTDFNGTGKAITVLGGVRDSPNAVALQPDGKIILVGSCPIMPTQNYFCAARYNSDGTLDSGFGVAGKILAVGMLNGQANAVALQPDGRIVLAGGCKIGNTAYMCAARLNIDGSLDSSFAGTGQILTLIGDTAAAHSAALQSDGRIVLAGECSIAAVNITTSFCALRYDANGSLDTTFNGTGSTMTVVGSGLDTATSMAIQPDGKIVLAGYCINSDHSAWTFCVTRYNHDGSLDSDFNTNGKVVTSITVGDNNAHAVVLQNDGKILIAGQCFDVSKFSYCALRLNSDGSLDKSFNDTGSVVTGVGLVSDVPSAIAIQPDGKAILAGSCVIGGLDRFCAIRYDGGPFGYKSCSLDIDGDGRVLATTDALINMRIALGIVGNAVIGGITFAANATRNTWPLIRDYLVTQCGMSLVR